MEWSTIKKINRRGVNFCQVLNKMHAGHGIQAITDGNQKWDGAIPALIINENIRKNGANEEIK